MTHVIARHIQQSLEPVAFVVAQYLNDLSDSELFVRPHPGMNHIAWQLGHLILSEHDHINAVTGDRMPPLPGGFREQHARTAANTDDRSCFCTKDGYVRLMREQRSAALTLLAGMSDAELMQPSPQSLGYLGATVGCVFASQSLHWMMHAGQWAVVRRMLGRSPLF